MVRTQGGFSLMEALISVLVLSIGVLGLARLQAQLWRGSGTLYATTDAYRLSGDRLERARGEGEFRPVNESERLQSASGHTLFTSTLRVETRDRLRVMEVANEWEDPAGNHQLRLLSAVYRQEPADTRWLLQTQ